jgi:hypothetical protein
MPDVPRKRSRDAWFVIRGFVHQVDATLERWTRLEIDQTLELEAGEDIDIVSQLLGERRFEQIKRSEKSLTLRSEDALEALANFVEHRSQEPGLRLSFRFATTASSGREKPAIVDGSEGALEVWKQFRKGNLEPSVARKALVSLKAFFSQARRPTDFNVGTWTRFVSWAKAADEDAIAGLIRSFEWSAEEAPGEDLRPKTVARLVELHGVRALNSYPFLFLYLIDRLRQKGLKRLTREDLKTAVQASVQGFDDDRWNAILEGYGTALEVLDGRVGNAEADILGLTSRLSEVEEVLKFPFSPSTEPSLKAPVSGPNVVLRAVHRDTLVEDLRNSLAVTLTGGAGMGKTELAIQVASEFERPSWLALRDLPEDRVDEILDWIGVRLEGPGAGHDVFSSDLLVLDDLPAVERGGARAKRLQKIYASARLRTIAILLTTNFLPSEPFAVGTIDRDVPLLDEADALAILRSLGLPDGVDTAARLLTSQVEGNVTLLLAAGRWWRAQDWSQEDSVFDRIWAGEYSTALEDETARRLVASVPNESARELLYRLKLAPSSFQERIVDDLAAVEPAVEHPRELLAQLRGAWIQEAGNGRLTVSPLVRMTLVEPPPAVANECRIRLAQAILNVPVLQAWEMGGSVTLLIQAEEWDMAGSVVVSGLWQVLQESLDFDPTGFADYWRATTIPHRMGLRNRLMIRAIQFALDVRFGSNSGRAREEYLGLLDTAVSESPTGALWSVASVALTLAKGDIASLLSALSRVAPLLSEGLEPDDEWDEPRNFEWSSMLALGAWGVDSEDSALGWLEVFARMSAEQRSRAAEAEGVGESARIIVFRVWNSEFGRPSMERDWPGRAAALGRLRLRAHELGLSFFASCAAAAEVLVLAHLLERKTEATVLAETALGSYPEARAQVLIRAAIGLEYVRWGWLSQAVTVLLPLKEFDATTLPSDLAVALLVLVKAFDEEPSEQTRVAERAVEVARKAPDHPELALPRTLACLAVQQYRQDGPLASVASLSEALQCLDDGPYSMSGYGKAFWATTFNVTSFLKVAVRAERSGRVENGTGPVSPPLSSFYVELGDQLTGYFQPVHRTLSIAYMAALTNALGDVDGAITWGRRSIRESGWRFAAWDLYPVVGVMAALEGRFEDVINLAVTAVVGSAQTATTDYESVRAAIESDAVIPLEGLSGDQRTWAANNALNLALPPITFSLALAALDGGPAYGKCLQAAATALEDTSLRYGDPPFRTSYLRLLNILLGNEDPSAELEKFAGEQSVREYERLFASVQLLASIFDPSGDSRILGMQVQAFERLLPSTEHTATIEAKLAVPFLVRFWDRRILNGPLPPAQQRTVLSIIASTIKARADRPADDLLRSIAASIIELPAVTPTQLYGFGRITRITENAEERLQRAGPARHMLRSLKGWTANVLAPIKRGISLCIRWVWRNQR